MSAAIRAEVLRAVSGSAGWAVAAYAVLVPFMLLIVAPGGSAASSPTLAVYSACAASFVAAMFLGSYGVTREYYDGSIGRALVLTRTRELLVAKAVAAALVSFVLGVIASVVWLGPTAIVLGSNGVEFAPGAELVPVAIGSAAASTVGGVLGSMIGWLTRNYYVASAIVLGIPFAVELPLLSSAPEIERFLPSGALAALGAPQGLGLLPPVAAAGVAAAWCLLAGAAAWATMRGREA
ncbi:MULTISPECIES: hypothetical protein [unclassified Rathayibacter]|uniref:hypothetical protein n=1 Tax=unclassified Rathayibacter TaxID=2609250 RepID=UPI00188A226F|nr:MULTISPECIES: hypothetical protein [unclassified Rathayibacter]MBF4461837.1 hypothetical protein [Rathayibacter sp. VKM Ac-2879]MBF4503250.1 hypothetical protein [Rathayibacter sp. VKM Ac-2878]